MRKAGVVLMVLLLCMTGMVLAQTRTTGRVIGKVVDEGGAAIEGALVTLEGTGIPGQRQANTNAAGEFIFDLVPVGDYLVTVSAPGKSPVQVTFTLQLGQTVPIDVVLKAGPEITEEITVTSVPAKMATTAQEVNFSVDTTVEELPIQNRTIEAVAFNAPNMAPGPNTTPRISGAPAFDTVVLLDGAEVSDPFFGGAPVLYIEDAIKDIQVLTSGVSARYGRFAGGVMNAITKSGGNEFHATLRLEYENEKWNSKTPWGEEQTDDLNWRAMGTVGGYIVKDRLWFFLGGYYEPSTTTSTTALNNDTFNTTADEDRAQYKLRGAITPEHILEANFLDFDRTTSGRAGLPAGDAQAIGTRIDPREILTFSYQGVLNQNLFLDVQYTDKEVSIASGGSPDKPSPVLELAQFRVYNNHWWDVTDPSIRNNDTFSANLTYTFDAGNWGFHTLEGGIQTVDSTIGGDNRQSATGYNLLVFDIAGSGTLGDTADFIVRDNGTPVSFNGFTHFNLNGVSTGVFTIMWQALELGAEAVTEYQAAYIQDTWELGKWRFDIGLRYEDYSGSGPLDIQTVDFSELSPRLGVTYNLTPNWQFQASWGRYLARFNDNYAGDVAGVSAAPRIEYFGYIGPDANDITGAQLDTLIRDPANWAFITDYVSPEFPTVISSPDLTSSSAYDLNLAVKHALPSNNGVFEIRYTHRRFGDLVDDFIGGAYQNIVTVTPIATDFDQTVWDNATEAKRVYDAITFTWDYRPSARWNVGGNYTWSQLVGNYEGEGTNTPASGTQIGDYPTVVPANGAYPIGKLNGDVTHRIRAWGNYRFDFKRWGTLSVGALFRFSSGTPWARTASVDVWLDDPAAVQEQNYEMTWFFEPRGANRFPSVWALDLSLRHQFRIVKDLNAWIKLDATNVLNRDHEVSFNTSGSAILGSAGEPVAFQPGPNFGKVTGPGNYQTPRTYLLTIGAAW